MKLKTFNSIPANLSIELQEHSIALIKNQFLNDNELLELAKKLSLKKGELKDKVLHWDFGPIMEMKAKPNATNYLFTEEKVPIHWDKAFFKEPQYLIFYCLQSEGVGGETLFCNSSLLYEDLKDNFPNLSLTYRTEKKAHYGGEFTTNLFCKHPNKFQNIVRFAEAVKTEKNPVELIINGTIENKENIYNQLVEFIYREKYLYEHIWQPNDLLIVDNFTFLHGRRELKKNLLRSFKRIQVL